MKKCLVKVILLLLIVLSINSICFASSSVTYFYGEGIKIDDKDVEILSYEMNVDQETSKVKNVILLNNNENKDKVIKITLPLENKEYSTTIHDLEILIDGVKVEYIKNDEGEYLVATKMMANEGKKIEVNYVTDNDLNNAKVIKYNLDNLKGRTVGKLKFEYTLPEKDIPLVEAIYPGHYKFDFDTKKLSVEYYNFEVTTITREIIVQKETYYNLRYGRETELTEYDKKVLDNIDDWIENGVKINYKNYFDEYSYLKDILKSNDNIYPGQKGDNSLSSNCYNIINYIMLKQMIIDNKLENEFKMPESGLEYNSTVVDFSFLDYKNTPLVFEIVSKCEQNKLQLKDKIVCIEFAQTEDDTKLYVYKNGDWNFINKNGVDEVDENLYWKEEFASANERDILKSEAWQWGQDGNNAKVIFIDEDIDGKCLNATDEEKIKYVNSINADLYVRVEIYDNDTKEVTLPIGYYDDNTYKIAKEFSSERIKEIISEELFNNDSYSIEKYINYDNYKNEINKYNNSLTIRISNELFEKKCEVPTLIYFTSHRYKENGKYVVDVTSYRNMFSFIEEYDREKKINNIKGSIVELAIQSNNAQDKIKANRENNDKIKEEAERKISNIKLTNDEEKIQEELKKEDEILSFEEEKSIFENKDVKVYGSIGIIILICIIVIIADNKKRNKKSNKENKN